MANANNPAIVVHGDPAPMRGTGRTRPALSGIPPAPSQRSVAGSTFIVMAASALSALLGFGREIITAHFFGTRSEMDAFLNASTIPTVLFGIFNGALVAALVPTFSEYMSLGRADEVRRLGSTIINALFVVTTGLAALGWLLAPYFVPIVAHGFPPAEQRLVVEMVRWLMPGIVATSLGGVCTALLNVNHRFVATALVWVAANLVVIGVIVALHRELGIFSLVLGSVLGLVAQFLVQFPSMLQHRLYRFAFDLRHPGLAKTWVLLLPVVVGSGAGQINVAFDRYFASTLRAGSTAGLGYTTKLVFLPSTVVAGAIATVIFPMIANQFASSNRAAIRRSIALALRMVSFIVIPCAVGLSVLAHPIVQTLFERGAFGPASTTLCASLIPPACVPLIAISYNSVLGRACYACKEVRLAVAGSTFAVLINIALSAAWSPTFGARGLLLANGVSGLFLLTFLTGLFWRLIGGFEWKPLLSSLSRIALASLAMAGVLYWILSLGFVPAATLASRAWYLGGLLVIGATVYLATARALRVEELTITVRTLMQKFGCGAGPAPTRVAAEVREQDDRANTRLPTSLPSSISTVDETPGPLADMADKTGGDVWVYFEYDDDGRAAAHQLIFAGFVAHYGQTGNSARPWLLILHNGSKTGDCSCPATAFRQHTPEEWETLRAAIEQHRGRIWFVDETPPDST